MWHKKFESAQLNELLPFINQKDAMNINWLKKKAVNERELRRKFLFFVLSLGKGMRQLWMEKDRGKVFSLSYSSNFFTAILPFLCFSQLILWQWKRRRKKWDLFFIIIIIFIPLLCSFLWKKSRFTIAFDSTNKMETMAVLR